MLNNVFAEQATGIASSLPWQAHGINIDSRKIKAGELFVALKGAVDGHAYVEAAFNSGAAAAVVERVPAGINPAQYPLLIVKNSQQALEEFGKYRRQHSKAVFVGVTGSVGKTSTKEALAAIYSKFGKTHATAGNFNNHLGVPITLATADPQTEFCICELGMNHSGEIAELTRQVRPHVAIITTIAPVHIQNFASLDGIAAAKAEIWQGLEPHQGTAIIPIDSPYYAYLCEQAKLAQVERIISFGEHPDADIRLTAYIEQGETVAVEALVFGEKLKFQSNIIGNGQVKNMLAALGVVTVTGHNLAVAANELSSLLPPQGRGRRAEVRLKLANDAILPLMIVDETYNASLIATKAAVENLAKLGMARKYQTVTILADMHIDIYPVGEDQTPIEHLGMLQTLSDNAIEHVIAVGPKMQQLFATLPAEMQLANFANTDACVAGVRAVLEKLYQANPQPCVILGKGGNNMQLWRVMQAIELLAMADA